MKKITAPAGVFGPYATVEKLADRYRVNDGPEIPFSVIGGAGTVSDWGRTPLPTEAPRPPEVPESVTRRQGIQQLLLLGITEGMVEAKIDTIPDELQRELSRIEFRTSTVFERTRPLLNMMWAAFVAENPDLPALDEVFIAAAKR